MTATPADPTHLAGLVDLASRAVGGSVIAANDESFAARQNLITPAAPVFQPHSFAHAGQIYDGWETRRRREPGEDWALIRLGLPGVVHAITVDTAFFVGNYPPEVSVHACSAEGYPPPAELAGATWHELVARTEVRGDAAQTFRVEHPHRFTHVRLTIHPDGGVARLRVHGRVVPDPRLLDPGSLGTGPCDLASIELGATILACSNMFYSTPANLLLPGPARHMGEGWETSRRRDDGNDWVHIGLAGRGTVRLAEFDTTWFLGNAPGRAALSGRDGPTGTWTSLLEPIPLRPDTRHRIPLPPGPPVTEVRMDAYPDGGMARLRLLGALTEDGADALRLRWLNTLPADHLHALPGTRDADLADRPWPTLAAVPATVRDLVTD
jgi:allantoicase